LRNELRASIDPPWCGTGSGSIPCGGAEARRRASDHPPTVRADVDRAPVFIGEVKIDVSGMLGDADVDGAFWSIELRPRFE
jgi:hypothetical protein